MHPDVLIAIIREIFDIYTPDKHQLRAEEVQEMQDNLSMWLEKRGLRSAEVVSFPQFEKWFRVEVAIIIACKSRLCGFYCEKRAVQTARSPEWQ